MVQWVLSPQCNPQFLTSPLPCPSFNARTTCNRKGKSKTKMQKCARRPSDLCHPLKWFYNSPQTLKCHSVSQNRVGCWVGNGLAWINSPDAVDMDSCKARNGVFLKPCNAIRIGFDVWTLSCRFLDLVCPGQSKKKQDMSKCRNLPKTDGGRKRCSQESLTWRRHVWRASGESLWGGRGRSKWCIWLSGHQMGNKVTVEIFLERCKSLADCNSPNS